jgi:hypothetical protein
MSVLEIATYTISFMVVVTTVLVFLRERNRYFNKAGDPNDVNDEDKVKPGTRTPYLGTQSVDAKFTRLYHFQGLAQAKISFWFSLIFAAIGFAIICIGLLTSISEDGISLGDAKTLVPLISGTIIDAVAALFFVQSNKARELMTEFFDRLRMDRKFEESLKLANDIPDPHMKIKIKIILSLHFAEIEVSDEFLAAILNETNVSKTKD